MSGSTIFSGNVIGHEMCVWFSSKTFIWNISHFKKNSARYYQKYRNVFTLSTRYRSFSNQTWIFSKDFRKKLTYKISWESVQWEPSCHMRTHRCTEGRTNVTKPTVAFRNFVNALKKGTTEEQLKMVASSFLQNSGGIYACNLCTQKLCTHACMYVCTVQYSIIPVHAQYKTDNYTKQVTLNLRDGHARQDD
jgi:hypothetical protein